MFYFTKLPLLIQSAFFYIISIKQPLFHLKQKGKKEINEM
jgi:hypothetical protein